LLLESPDPDPFELVAEGWPALDPDCEPAPEAEPAALPEEALEPLWLDPVLLSLEVVPEGCEPEFELSASPDELPFWPLPLELFWPLSLELLLPSLSLEPVPDG
jgi:hypothetical protein